MISPARFGICVCVIAIIFGPLYSEPEYSFLRNSVSQLGAQNTKNNWVMVLGFITLGVTLSWEAFLLRSSKWIAFGLFGLCFALSGLLPHESWINGRESTAWMHSGHQMMANLSGFFICVAHLVFGLTSQRLIQKWISYGLSFSCILFPLAMFQFPAIMGLIQKTMYALTFIWLWWQLPKS